MARKVKEKAYDMDLKITLTITFKYALFWLFFFKKYKDYFGLKLWFLSLLFCFFFDFPHLYSISRVWVMKKRKQPVSSPFSCSFFVFLCLFIHFIFLSHVYWFSLSPTSLSFFLSLFLFLHSSSLSLTYLLVKQCSWGGPFSYSLFSFLNLFIYPSLLSHIYWSNNVVGEMTLPPFIFLPKTISEKLNWEIWAKGSQLVDNEPNVLLSFIIQRYHIT